MLVGTLSVFVGAMVGLILAFILGRFVFRQCSEKFARKYQVTKALEHAIRTEGLKVVALLRLCPLISFTVFNYVMGITSVSFLDYLLGSVAILPGTIVYVFIGTTIGSIQDAATGNYDSGPAGLIFLIVGSVLACVAIIWISIVVRKYLNSAMENEEANNNVMTANSNADSGRYLNVAGEVVDSAADGVSQPLLRPPLTTTQ